MREQKKYPVAEGLFTWPSDEPRLIGGRCNSCGTYFFPKFHVLHSPDCSEWQIEEVLLSNKGKLASYTIMYYPSPPPFVYRDPYVPHAVGLVSLPEGIQILGMLTDCPNGKLKTQLDVELVIDTLFQDEKGNDVVAWKWRPII